MPRVTRPKSEDIQKLLKRKGFSTPIRRISQYLEVVRSTCDLWQHEDWNEYECDEDLLLNDARIVGQVWFRGHSNWDLSLRPGLYRETRRSGLVKQPGSPTPTDHRDDHLFDELFNLEHELRIDFTSYGHLLNAENEAKTPIDWYFLMQHHGLPTRLLDWTTNALAALFFALEHQSKEARKGATPSAQIAVWMVDSYWLADHLSSEWTSPLLAWSNDAERYVPPLEVLIEKMEDSEALLPRHAMPIEPPAMHPRVAAQEGRFIIFGRTQDLLDERIRLEFKADHSGIEELRLGQIRFQIDDVDALLRELAQLGVSRRTLFPDLAGLADFVEWKHFHKLRGYKATCSLARRLGLQHEKSRLCE